MPGNRVGVGGVGLKEFKHPTLLVAQDQVSIRHGETVQYSMSAHPVIPHQAEVSDVPARESQEHITGSAAAARGSALLTPFCGRPATC